MVCARMCVSVCVCVAVNGHACYIWIGNDITNFILVCFLYHFLSLLLFRFGLVCVNRCVCLSVSMSVSVCLLVCDSNTCFSIFFFFYCISE